MVLATVLELVQVLQQDLDPEGVEEVPHLLDLEVVAVGLLLHPLQVQVLLQHLHQFKDHGKDH